MIRSGSLLVLLFVPPSGEAHAQTFDWNRLRLPDRVQAQVVDLPVTGSGEPSDRIIVDESLAGLSGRQDLRQGSLGWAPLDATYASESETLLYNVSSRRAVRMAGLSGGGRTRLDGFATPLGWLRFGKFVQAEGGSINITESAGTLSLTLARKGVPTPRFHYLIDAATSELKTVKLGDTNEATVFSYDDWREIAKGRRLPMLIGFEAPAHGSVPLVRRRWRVESSEFDDSKPLERIVLPAEAIVEDQLEQKLVYGDGREVPAGPNLVSPSSSQAAKQSYLGYGYLGAGTAMLLGAAVVFRLRRQGAR